MATSYLRQPPMPMPQQIARMRSLYPNLALTSWHAGRTRWSGELQPTDMSDRYLVAIDYRLKHPPEVSVLAPELRCHENGAPVPHRFSDGTLCLYLTNSGEWTPRAAIAETTVPWTALWLYYYEVWLATGLWLGGGVHSKKRKQQH
jgi:hypothetical protein